MQIRLGGIPSGIPPTSPLPRCEALGPVRLSIPIGADANADPRESGWLHACGLYLDHVNSELVVARNSSGARVARREYPGAASSGAYNNEATVPININPSEDCS